MKIVVCPYNWFDCTNAGLSGGEIYLDRLLDFIQTQGHEIKIIAGNNEYYERKGIPVYPQGEPRLMMVNHSEHFQWCDAVLGHLIGSPFSYNKAHQFNKPLIWIAHNNSKDYAVKFFTAGKLNVIYNSYQLREDLFNTLGHQNGVVLHPLMPELKRAINGTFITLVNCNENKGGSLLIEIAKRLPQYRFLGVLGGYGDQIKEDLPNLEYYVNGTDMATVYQYSKLILVPSEFESFSQVATEAMISGIPVIAHPTKGLLENLSGAGIFIDRKDINKYVQTIVSLLSNDELYKKQSDICYERGLCVKEKSEEEKIRFNNWLNKIK